MEMHDNLRIKSRCDANDGLEVENFYIQIM